MNNFLAILVLIFYNSISYSHCYEREEELNAAFQQYGMSGEALALITELEQWFAHDNDDALSQHPERLNMLGVLLEYRKRDDESLKEALFMYELAEYFGDQKAKENKNRILQEYEWLEQETTSGQTSDASSVSQKSRVICCF